MFGGCQVGIEIGSINADLILLKATAHVFGMTLAEQMASKNSVSVAKASLDLGKTISEGLTGFTRN